MTRRGPLLPLVAPRAADLLGALADGLTAGPKAITKADMPGTPTSPAP